MEIKIGEKTYKLAWEYIIAPLLLLLAVSILIIARLSDLNPVWIEYRDGASATPEITLAPAPTEPWDNPSEERDEGIELADSSDNSNLQHKRININKAGMEELMTLPFIGEVKARAIIEYRTTNGPFKSVDELDNVKGIGAKTLEKLRPLVTVAD